MENYLIIFITTSFLLFAAFHRLLLRRPFDRAWWDTHPKDRWRVVHDLIRREYLRGMNRDEIAALLGNPDYASGCTLAYWLSGNQFGDKLRIILSSDGRASKAKFEGGCGDP